MKRFLSISVIFLFPFFLIGQDIEFTASSNKSVVGLEESFTLTFKLNASGSKFKPPVLSDNFKIYSGPNQSTSMSYVNGRMSTSLSYQYLLVPINEGKYIIEPATIEVDGESLTSNPIEVQVVKEKTSNNQQNKNSRQNSGRNQQQNQQQQKKINIGDNLFLRLSVNKKNAAVGEQIIASYKLYNRLDLTGIEGQKLPDFVGFYTNEVEIDQNANGSREVIDGVIYQVYLLKKTTLFPQRTGELELRPLELTATIREREATPINTFFGPRYQYKQRRVPLKSNSLTINVSPHLGQKPVSYSGAVGTFNLSSSVDNISTPVNGAINLKYSLTGTGNLKLVDLPEFDFPVDFEVYDPKISSNIKNPSGTVSGSKSFEYLIIPRVPGTFSIPDVTLHYYNPSSKTFETTTAKGYEFTIVDDGSGTAEAARVRQKRDIQQIGKDIRFIKTEHGELSQESDSFFGSVWFVLGYLIPTLLAVGVYIALRRYNLQQADQIGLRKRRAGKLASKQLKRANDLLNEGDTVAFYEELSRALTEYVSGKLVVPMSEMSKDKIKNELASRTVDESSIKKLIAVLEECEMARFAPGAVSGQQSAYKSAEEVINELEKALA